MTTFTIDLPDETAAQVRADAEAQGVDETSLLRALVMQRYATAPARAQSSGNDERDGAPDRTLAEVLGGLIGVMHSGGADRLPEKTGHAFTDYVIRKKREGRL